MLRKLLIIILMAVGLITSLPVCAAENIKSTAHTKVQLFTNGKNEIIVRMNIAPQWHISWQNPGDVGLPTTLTLSNGQARIINQSVPQIRRIYEVMDEYIYENSAYYHLNIPSFNENTLNVFFVECNDVCKQENLHFNIDDLAISSTEDWQKIKAQAEQTFPQKIKLTSPQNDNRLLFEQTSDAKILFIPTTANIIDKDSIKLVPQRNKTEISWQNTADNKLKQALIIDGDKSFLADIIYTDLSRFSLLYIIVLAFLGGIILNAMPCVFPILSLKIFTLIRERHLKRRWPHAIGYILGVIFCFMILACFLVMLKRQGEAIGWGFQLQSPWFVGIMGAIFLILFFFMIDWWHFPSIASRRLHRAAGLNAFTTGFFAVLIASPCTGPFMGAAIGYAFMQSTLVLYSVFLALALGYALPYALIVLYPRIISRIMPKPGKWMHRIKIILSVPILMTSLWLFSVLGAQIHSNWHSSEAQKLSWKTYNAAEIEELAAQNEKILIDFTADWCLTCQFNEKILFNSEKFRNYVQENNIHLYKADLTQDNDEYNQALSSYGRDGIPLYVYYHNGNFEILPVFFRLSSLKK